MALTRICIAAKSMYKACVPPIAARRFAPSCNGNGPKSGTAKRIWQPPITRRRTRTGPQDSSPLTCIRCF